MTAQIEFLLGPARSGKSAAAWERYLAALAQRRGRQLLWLAPNHHAVRGLRARLAASGTAGCIAPGIFTFAQFASEILLRGDCPLRPLDHVLKRQVLGQVVASALAAGQLAHFGSIAASDGFLSWLDDLISDLKRQEIWPEDFSAALRAFSRRAKDRELALLYAEYQKLLEQRQCYDQEGRFWLACEQLRKGSVPRSFLPDIVIVDGFSDFSRAQLTLLEILSLTARQLCITLPAGVTADERPELFAKPGQTLAELRRRFAHATETNLGRIAPALTTFGGTGRAPQPPVFAHLERHLFGNPRAVVPPVETDGLQIWPCAGELLEARQVAREVKRLLARGATGECPPVSPERIAVVYRTLNTSAEMLRQVFTEFGIPHRLEAGLPLAQSPLPRLVLSALRWHRDDWPYRGFLALLENTYWEITLPNTPSAAIRRATTAAVREMQVLSGAKNWLAAATRRQATLQEIRANAWANQSENSARWESAAQQAELATAALTELHACFRLLPPQATWREWGRHLTAWAERLGILRVAAQPLPLPQNATTRQTEDTADLAAWRQMLGALQGVARWEKWSGVAERQITLADLFHELQLICDSECLPPDNDGVGRVQILSAPAARVGEWDYLFLAGLTEKAFPLPGQSDRLYSGEEMRCLNQSGTRFTERTERANEELLLFYELVTKPVRGLVLSYPALDDKAESLSPSPYLQEVLRVCGQTPVQPIQSLSPVPPADRVVCSPREALLRAMDSALAGTIDPLARQLSPATGQPSAPLLAGLRSLAARASGPEFGSWEGMLGHTELAQLQRRFGDDHCWSISQLELYAECPFKFFADKILGLAPPADLAFETDYLRRGIWLHAALAKLYREWQATGQTLADWTDRPAEYARLCARVARETAPDGGEGELGAVFLQLDEKFVLKLLTAHLQQAEKYQKQNLAELRPRHFEVAFGPGKTSDRDDPLCTSKPWKFTAEEFTLNLSGQIDRIDLGQIGSEPVFRIIDYKSGKTVPKLNEDILAAGQALQLSLYAWAVRAHLAPDQGLVPWQIGYWALQGDGPVFHGLAEQKEGKLMATEAWTTAAEELPRRVAGLVRGIQRGEFPMFNENDKCTSGCDYKTICRVAQARSLEKTWAVPARPLP
ncbi:MAG: PD-(D/E)XK nuclease family protein [Pirellulales bacterium]|nr:PD-(D/E)XK nuclease family protein [Pirellulales bacterium]